MFGKRETEQGNAKRRLVIFQRLVSRNDFESQKIEGNKCGASLIEFTERPAGQERA